MRFRAFRNDWLEIVNELKKMQESFLFVCLCSSRVRGSYFFVLLVSFVPTRRRFMPLKIVFEHTCSIDPNFALMWIVRTRFRERERSYI